MDYAQRESHRSDIPSAAARVDSGTSAAGEKSSTDAFAPALRTPVADDMKCCQQLPKFL